MWQPNATTTKTWSIFCDWVSYMQWKWFQNKVISIFRIQFNSRLPNSSIYVSCTATNLWSQYSHRVQGARFITTINYMKPNPFHKFSNGMIFRCVSFRVRPFNSTKCNRMDMWIYERSSCRTWLFYSHHFLRYFLSNHSIETFTWNRHSSPSGLGFVSKIAGKLKPIKQELAITFRSTGVRMLLQRK